MKTLNKRNIKKPFKFEEVLEALNDNNKEDALREFFEFYEKLNACGLDILEHIDNYFNKESSDLENVFPSFVYSTEYLLHKNTDKITNTNYKFIQSFIVALYDSLLNLINVYHGKSAMGCASFGRIIFEARVNLEYISKEPDKNSRLYSVYKRVAVLWHEYHLLENPTEEDRKSLKSKLYNFPDWYDETWNVLKRKGQTWTGRANFDLRNMCMDVGLEDEYKANYKINSKFIHVSPLLENYYKANGGTLICKEKHLINIVYPALEHYVYAIGSLYDIIGLDRTNIVGALQLSLDLYRKRQSEENV